MFHAYAPENNMRILDQPMSPNRDLQIENSRFGDISYPPEKPGKNIGWRDGWRKG